MKFNTICSVACVMCLFQHEDYDDGSGTFANDISLLELSEELSFNDAVQPISLPSSGQSFTGDDCVLSGWGRTSGSGCKYHSIGFVSPVDSMVQSLCFESVTVSTMAWLTVTEYLRHK